jgi:Secretion system C-terminal sorting domain/FG-GAP repeat
MKPPHSLFWNSSISLSLFFLKNAKKRYNPIFLLKRYKRVKYMKRNSYPSKLSSPILIALIICTLSKVYAQDSLYLVGSITGESNSKNITNVKGIGDINGDGYDDFMVSVRTGKKIKDEGIVKLYLGSADGNLVPDVTFHYPGKDSLNDFGQNFAGIGDVNRDGYNDFIIGGIFDDWGSVKGKCFLYLGGETVDTIPLAEFHEPWIEDGFGNAIEGLGDINKDGYDDFIICDDYNWTNGKGYAYLFWGGDTISWNKSLAFTSDSLTDFFGVSAANIGDINKDGFDDIAIGASAWASGHDTGKVYIFYGSNQIDNKPGIIFIGSYLNESFGSIIKNGGDLNKNSKVDFFIAGGIYVYVYQENILLCKINGYLHGGGGYINIESKFDINNDGYNDFIIGNTNYRNSDSVMVGGAFIYLGKENIDSVYKYKFEGQNQWGEFSKIMTHADINGDGFDEILIMAPGFPNYENPLGKVYIYSYKKFTDIKDHKGYIPENFKLYQNYPNPFNPSTTINYQLSMNNHVTVKVFDILGRVVAILVNEAQSAGKHEIEFDADKYNLSSGVYFYELRAKDNALYKKMVLLR